MFRDKDAELERLEQALLDEEEPAEEVKEEYLNQDALEALWEDTRPGDTPRVYQNHANDYGRGLRNYATGYRAYNADRTDMDPETLGEEVLGEDKKGFGWLLGLLIALLGALVAAIVYLFLQLGGMV